MPCAWSVDEADMTSEATERTPLRRAVSACEAREVRRVRSEPPPRSTIEAEEADRTVLAVAEPTSVERVAVFRAPATDFQVLTRDMIEELRQRLRAAEAAEGNDGTDGSGIRLRPTPEEGSPAWLRDTALEHPVVPRAALDPREEAAIDAAIAAAASEEALEDVEVEIEAARTLGEWAQSLTEPPVVEVALAPHSESNFYGGFDDEYPDGVSVATYQAIVRDTPVYAVVHLPGGYRFRTPALVECVREPEAAPPDAPAGVGLRMCGLDGRMRRLIREFAKHRPPMFYVG